MKVVILTSSRYGTAAHHLPCLLESNVCDISMVILNQGVISDKIRHYRRKISKIRKIGVLGAINGIRMRKWFNDDMAKYKKIENLEDICRKNNIPFYETPQINCDKTRELFENSRADLGLSLGNGYIGESVFNIPRYGMINIHHEILPAFQNAQSIIWQIYNESHNTGYTIHKIDRHIDTGEILYQQSVPINFCRTLAQTVTSTSVLLLENSANGLLHVIKNFSDLQNQAKPQENGRSYTTPSIWQFILIMRNFYKLKNRDAEINPTC